MDCKQTQKHFTAYLDCDLETNLAGQVKDHLNSCQTCRSELSVFNTMIDYLHGMEPLPTPPDLLPGIHEKLDQQGFFAKVFQRWRQLDFSMSLQSATATIAVAFAIMAVIKTFPLDQQTNQDKSQTTIAQHEQGPQTAAPTNQPQNLPSRAFSDRSFIRPDTQPVFDSFSSRNSRTYLPHSSTSALQERLDNFSPFSRHTRTHQPDMTVTANDLIPSLQASLYNSLISEESWQTRVSENEVIVYLRPHQIRKLQHLLTRHMVSLPLTDFHSSKFNPHKKVWTVAVQLR